MVRNGNIVGVEEVHGGGVGCAGGLSASCWHHHGQQFTNSCEIFIVN